MRESRTPGSARGAGGNSCPYCDISGFGTFGIAERSERQGRNPQTGEVITIAASKGAKFTPGKAIKTALNGD